MNDSIISTTANYKAFDRRQRPKLGLIAHRCTCWVECSSVCGQCRSRVCRSTWPAATRRRSRACLCDWSRYPGRRSFPTNSDVDWRDACCCWRRRTMPSCRSTGVVRSTVALATRSWCCYDDCGSQQPPVTIDGRRWRCSCCKHGIESTELYTNDNITISSSNNSSSSDRFELARAAPRRCYFAHTYKPIMCIMLAPVDIYIAWVVLCANRYTDLDHVITCMRTSKAEYCLRSCRSVCVCMRVCRRNNWKTTNQKLVQLGRNICYVAP